MLRNIKKGNQFSEQVQKQLKAGAINDLKQVQEEENDDGEDYYDQDDNQFDDEDEQTHEVNDPELLQELKANEMAHSAYEPLH
jgi:hypothetical protein